MSVIYDRQRVAQGGKDGPGHGFYPADLTKADFEAYLVVHPAEKAALMDGYTVVKREGAKLVAVPYSVEYKAELEKAAERIPASAVRTAALSLGRTLR